MRAFGLVKSTKIGFGVVTSLLFPAKSHAVKRRYTFGCESVVGGTHEYVPVLAKRMTGFAPPPATGMGRPRP